MSIKILSKLPINNNSIKNIYKKIEYYNIYGIKTNNNDYYCLQFLSYNNDINICYPMYKLIGIICYVNEFGDSI